MNSTLILLLLLLSCCVHHVFGFQSLSSSEELELQKILELHRKPVVTIIKTKDGDKYNCIDFYDQPAFDHPNLKNHKYEFKMSPSSSSFEDDWAAKIWENGKGCPIGTVPIKRYTRSDLIRAIRVNHIHAFNLNLTRNAPSNVQNSQYYYALARQYGENRVYGGISMYASLYNPRVADNEYSSIRMTISGGNDLIQAGWTVNPALSHDHQTRFSIFTKMDSMYCFNDLCPGFVGDNPAVPLDFVFKRTSIVGGHLLGTYFKIFRDQGSGNWALTYGGEPGNKSIGYWPKNIFAESGLRNLASNVEWGGEVFSPSGNVDNLPEMGSGYREFLHDANYTGFCCNLKVKNEAGQIVDAPDNMYRSVQDPYRMTLVENLGRVFEKTFFFGGPITKA